MGVIIPVMLDAFISLIVGCTILLLVEWLHSRGSLHTEVARKIIHVVAGVTIAIWPFFVGWDMIIFAGLGLMVIVSVTRRFKLFGSQHGINRITWGEFFFPAGIILTVLMHPPRWIFVLAMLHLALGDTVAALIGSKFGHSNSYKIIGQKKSVAGSAAFFAVSVVLVAIAFTIVPAADISASVFTALFLLPIIATVAENIGVYGLDNLFIPISVVLLLR